MVKSPDELTAITSFMSNSYFYMWLYLILIEHATTDQPTTDEYWVGMVNPGFVLCDGKAACTDKVKWIDGTTADASTVNHFNVKYLIAIF